MLTERCIQNVKGMASIELVLTIPILILMLVLFKQAHYLMLMQQQLVVGARTAGWNKALNDECKASFTLTTSPAAGINTPFTCSQSDAQANLNNDKRFWPAMKEAGGGNDSGGFGVGEDASGITDDISEVDTHPLDTKVDAKAKFPFFGINRPGTYELTDSYVVHMNDYWTEETKPFRDPNWGYDKFLQAKMSNALFGDPLAIFPYLFPRLDN